MSDQKKWFKVWSSILTDPGFQNIRLEDVGRWTLLGCLICQQGENGKLVIIPPASGILFLFKVDTIENLKRVLLVLPNVQITPPLNDNGNFIVSFRKWFKYQVDSTAYDRVKRSRYKRRGEEKRSLTSTSTSTSPASRDPLAGSASRANGGEETWPQNTKEVLPESERMSPTEMKAWKERTLRAVRGTDTA